MSGKKKIQIRKPDYFERFQCSASDCTDNCCIGWEIDIDERTAERYKKVQGELGQKLKDRILREGEDELPHFILQGERCPFLGDNNLCELINELGESSLCDICREHPRFYEWFDGLTEMGLGLCCEEAARLILESPEKADFVAVSYTHLDVYKRQVLTCTKSSSSPALEKAASRSYGTLVQQPESFLN